ncbi:MAG: hypothetical protein R3D66_04290 [Alphaproteobacteria bacterium]
MAKVRVCFRSTAPNETINVLSSSWGKHGGSSLWWERYKWVKEDFNKNGSLETRFRDFPKEIQSWRSSTLKTAQKGHLDQKQIDALNEIGFFQAKKGKGHTRSGERIDRTIALYQHQGPLTAAEAFELRENIEYYEKQYTKGALSPISAQKLGILKPYDLVPNI